MEVSEITNLLSQFSPTLYENYCKMTCPQCGRSKAFWFSLETYQKYGLWTWGRCNHLNSCAYNAQLREILNIKGLEKDDQSPHQKAQAELFAAHGLDFWGMKEGRILGEFGELKLRKDVYLDLRKNKNGKFVWFAPSKNRWSKAENGAFTKPMNPLDSDELYVMAGIWDFLKGFCDGLNVTTSIYGEGTLPGNKDWWVFEPYRP